MCLKIVVKPSKQIKTEKTDIQPSLKNCDENNKHDLYGNLALKMYLKGDYDPASQKRGDPQFVHLKGGVPVNRGGHHLSKEAADQLQAMYKRMERYSKLRDVSVVV
jgi:hypothetical protein